VTRPRPQGRARHRPRFGHSVAETRQGGDNREVVRRAAAVSLTATGDRQVIGPPWGDRQIAGPRQPSRAGTAVFASPRRRGRWAARRGASRVPPLPGSPGGGPMRQGAPRPADRLPQCWCAHATTSIAPPDIQLRDCRTCAGLARRGGRGRPVTPAGPTLGCSGFPGRSPDPAPSTSGIATPAPRSSALGAQAAEHGLRLSSAADLYLSWARRGWPLLPSWPTPTPPPSAPPASGSYARDDAAATLAQEGWAATHRALLRREESARRHLSTNKEEQTVLPHGVDPLGA
jgi:hypothetical protein